MRTQPNVTSAPAPGTGRSGMGALRSRPQDRGVATHGTNALALLSNPDQPSDA